MGEETGKKKIHPHQKPVALYRWLLDWYAPKNDLLWNRKVFDPFAGSGSLGVACREKGYDYVGVEISKVFCEAAAKRLGVKMEVVDEPQTEGSSGPDNVESG